MSSSLTKFKRGVAALATVFLLAVVAFHFLAGYDWIDAIWMVVITISTVGYGESSDASTVTKLLSVGLILVGVTAGAYTFGGLIQMALEGELDRVLGRRRMENELKRLHGHTIICGFSRTGQILARQLNATGRSFVVVDNDEAKIAEIAELGYTGLQDDATEEACLTAAGVERASAIVIALPTDAENVFITLTARNMCPSLRIVAQAERESSLRKLNQAGANEVVMAHKMVAQHMARLITRPSTANLVALLSESSDLDVELDELRIPVGNELIGHSIAELAIRDRYGLLVVGVKPADAELVFNPEANRPFTAHETILIMGRAEDVDRFRVDKKLLV